MNNTVVLSYIDDMPDPKLSRYLDEYTNERVEITYKDLRFETANTYENLLDTQIVIESNIIVIDSRLFQNDNAGSGKFTGEEFEILLKRVRPYVEVIVITQNPIEEGFDKVRKWQSSNSPTVTYKDFYDMNLKPRLDSSVDKILQFRAIMDKLLNDDSDLSSSDIVQSISDSLQGVFSYEMLNSEKIDELISVFEDVRKRVDGQRL